VAPRTQMLPVYVPAEVGLTQLGESFSTQLVVPVPLFVSCAAHPPVWPPATRARVTAVPDVFQPVVSVSKPGFATKLTASAAVLVLPESLPVIVCGPPTVARPGRRRIRALSDWGNPVAGEQRSCARLQQKGLPAPSEAGRCAVVATRQAPVTPQWRSCKP